MTNEVQTHRTVVYHSFFEYKLHTNDFVLLITAPLLVTLNLFCLTDAISFLVRVANYFFTIH